MGDEIGEGFGAAASEGDIDESGYDADEDAVQDKLGSEAAANPDGEDKTGEERGGRCGVGEGIFAGEQSEGNNERDYGDFGEESGEQDSQPADTGGGGHDGAPLSGSRRVEIVARKDRGR